jgi:hypothetical protein
MAQQIPYSAGKQDLFFPAASLDPFPKTCPKTDAELCAWMSWLSYRDQGTNFGFDRNGIQSVLRMIGFENVFFLESTDQTKRGGTHCFLAIQGEPGTKTSLAVVAFRGTNAGDMRDLLDDVEMLLVDWDGKGKIFQGFKLALAEIQSSLDDALTLFVPNSRLLFTGHSLGAAMATLLASRKAPAALYTFGSPRVGDEDFVGSLAAVKCYRYVDCCDAVAELPLPLGGYQHVCDPLYIDRNRAIASNPGADFIRADQFRAQISYALHHSWKPGEVLTRSLADHAPINYVTAIAAAEYG